MCTAHQGEDALILSGAVWTLRAVRMMRLRTTQSAAMRESEQCTERFRNRLPSSDTDTDTDKDDTEWPRGGYGEARDALRDSAVVGIRNVRGEERAECSE